MNVRGFALLAAAAAAGCAVSPEVRQSVVNAREAVQQAQADANVTRHAPRELAEASGSLARAERLAEQGADSNWVEHQAYLATQRARIARQTATARAAESELEQASAERERVMLEARAREAEMARARAEQEAQSAASARLAAEQKARTAEQAAKEKADAELVQELERLRSQVAELQTQQSARGTTLRLTGEVLFDVGQATLKPGARRALENLAAVLRRQPDRQIVVEGFTDSTGDANVNQQLSEARAEAVRQALVQFGVPRENIEVRGLGAAYPIADNSTSAGRQLNRRVEITIPGVTDASALGGGRAPASGAAGGSSTPPR